MTVRIHKGGGEGEEGGEGKDKGKKGYGKRVIWG